MKFNLTMAKRFLALSAAVCLAASLTACGGGGDDGGHYESPAEGFYQGTLSNSTGGTAMQMLVLEDDSFWSIYGDQTNLGFHVNGFVQGHGSSSDGSFISYDMRDFGAYPARAATVSATYGGGNIGGTWNYSNGYVGFSGVEPLVSSYNYWTPANLATIVGPWSLTTLSNETLSFTVLSSGVLASTSGPCAYSGAITPRASQINVFDLSVTFTSGSCFLIGQTLRGIAVSSPVAGGARQLIIAGVDGSRTYGMAAVGVR